jgi:hypothetical protein
VAVRNDEKANFKGYLHGTQILCRATKILSRATEFVLYLQHKWKPFNLCRTEVNQVVSIDL